MWGMWGNVENVGNERMCRWNVEGNVEMEEDKKI
jgi:hypothetical protein